MSSAINRRGLMLVLSSPSGAGKTTLARGLLESDGNINMSVSVTTRKPRPGETDGQDYHFVDAQAFGEMRNRDELLEHAKVFDNYYGTPRAPVEEALAAGRDVLFDIDWQGTQQLQLLRALPVNIEQYIATCRQRLFNRCARRAVIIIEHLGMLQ